jgi:protein arginine kinase
VTVEELAKSEGIWVSEGEVRSDIVLKSSVAFSRNINGYLFGHKLENKSAEEVDSVLIEKIGQISEIYDISIYRLSQLPPNDIRIFFERNFLRQESPSKNFIVRRNGTDRGQDGHVVILAEDQHCFFVLGGRDHIEFATIQSGFRLDEAYVRGKKIIGDLEKLVGFVFKPGLGYLNADPARLGAGIEISVTLHLAGLTISDRINEVSHQLKNVGIGLRSSWLDPYYEVYNKSSTGRAEKILYEDSLGRFEDIIKLEKETRDTVYRENRSSIEDRVWRSYGILLSSRLISLYEALDHLSRLRLGISLGIIDYITVKDINLLLYYIQDNHLIRMCNIQGELCNLEEARARFLRDYLKEVI